MVSTEIQTTLDIPFMEAYNDLNSMESQQLIAEFTPTVCDIQQFVSLPEGTSHMLVYTCMNMGSKIPRNKFLLSPKNTS